MSQEFVARGAEAKLYKENGKLVKERLSKGYRIKSLDQEIRKSRTKNEVSIIGKARRAGVNTPTIFEEHDYTIVMEFIDGDKVKNILNEDNLESICRQIGDQVGKLHKWNLVHGDLTTSNMILKDNDLYLIDFGLAQYSEKDEDKAMDLKVLEEALLSAHYELYEEALDIIYNVYKLTNGDHEPVLDRLDQIRKRGRYKEKD